jgi:diadenosine tetraphosphate (Ap4A) HIT family hydrolase
MEHGVLLTTPIRHAERVEDLAPGEFASLLRAVSVADAHFERDLGSAGAYFAFNDGGMAGQETPHVHVHIWARPHDAPTNPFTEGLPRGMGRPTPEQSSALRDLVRAAIDRRSR